MSSLPVSRQPIITSTKAAEQASIWSELTDAERIMITQRRELVDAWRRQALDFRAAGRPASDATRLFLAVHPELTERRLYRLAKRRDSDDPRDLLDGRRNNGGPREEASSSIGDAAWSAYTQVYLSHQRRTVALCYQIVKAEAEQHADDPAWSWPSLRTVQERTKRDLPPIISDYTRLGEREWDRRFGPRMRRDFTQYRSNQHWNGDCHPCDVFCRTSDADWTIVRPTLSAFQDLRSRMIVGWHITLVENSDAVLLAFRNGVEKYGPPNDCTIDNGKPYRARGFSGGRPGKLIEDEDYVRSVLGGLDVKVHFAIPYNPDSKPIERFFRTFEEQFGATFATYCGSVCQDERFKAAHQLAKEHPERCPTVAEYTESVGRYLAAYHATPHTGSGMEGLSPAEAFARFDPIPMAVVPDGALDILLMRTYSGTKSKDGTKSRLVKVTKFGVRYNSIEYGANEPRLIELIGQEVTLRIHPTDASYVIVCDLAGKPICKARNDTLVVTGVNQEHVTEGMRQRRKALRQMREVAGGSLRAASQSVTDAAITARLKQGIEATKERLAATGTDDQAPEPRRSRPLRSDMADAARRIAMQADRPISVDVPPSNLPDDDDDRELTFVEPDEPDELPDWEDENDDRLS
jgi:transposase InsO family protein